MSNTIDLLVDDGLFGESKDPFIHKEDDYTLSELIPRILMERKSFLNLTEESLQQEIQLGNEPTEITVESNSEQDKQPDDNDQVNELKAELTKNINLALNETSLSLDLVSLLLSSSKPNLAKATMSPFLSKNVPIGSLNSDKLQDTANISHNESLPTTHLIGQGWKNESINKIQNLFQTKAASLSQQIKKDGIYWSMVNKVLNNDEILIKLRDPLNNSKSIGVKYGYGDSGSNYSDKGIAVLRRDDATGEIEFNPISESHHKFILKKFKYIRVRILSQQDNQYTVTGISKFNPSFNAKGLNHNVGDINDKEKKLINDIEMARFFIFEEDLFYNLLREARTLVSYNVQILSNKIIIEIGNEIIEIESIDYVPNSASVHETEGEETGGQDDHKCCLILNYLKIMLCGYYKYNLSLKQKIPTKFTKFKQNNSHPLILRPLIGSFNHEINLNKITTTIKKFQKLYHDDVESTLNIVKYDNMKTLITNPFIKSIEKPVSKFTITLKNKLGKYLKINMTLTSSEIFVNLIIHVNIIKFDTLDNMNDNEKGINVLQLTFNDIVDIEQCLDWSIQNFMVE